MLTNVKQSESTTKWYDIPYTASAYTFPGEAFLHRVDFEDGYMRLDLTDGRVLLVPLWWIPTLYNAEAEDREKYEISQDRKMIVWDPDKCSINDEVRVDDFLITRPHPA
jgi:hypothetical protein